MLKQVQHDKEKEIPKQDLAENRQGKERNDRKKEKDKSKRGMLKQDLA